ncbi:hypothetical protein BGW39_004801 [Mortierella sp. 14UC]|nr:hypothetical protein BGW39_004801 [Mortierella sp. 14UC]
MSQPAQKAKKKKKDRQPKIFDHSYAKVTQVPELVEVILSFLNQRTLRLTASLVCRLWRTVALPLLVRPAVITIGPANKRQLDPFNKDKSDQEEIDSIKGARTLVIKPSVVDPYWGVLGPPRLEPVRHQALMDRLRDLAREKELRVVDLQIRHYMDDYQADILPLLSITGFQLTSLSLEQMHFQEFFPLDEILLLCPRVLHVTVSQAVPSYYRLWPMDDPDYPAPPSLPDRIPLRSLSLQAIGIETECLLRLLRAAPALTDLELTKMIGGMTTTTPSSTISTSQSHPHHFPPSPSSSPFPPNSIALKDQDFVSWSNIAAIEKIASAAPQISRLSISMNKPSKIKSADRVRVLQMFPSLKHWTSPSFDISSHALENIRTTIADRVTSLEITGQLNQDIVGKALHQYLCGTPHLQHLRAPGMQISVAWLDVEGILGRDARYRRQRDDDKFSSFKNEQLQARVWLTGNLKTLDLGFGAGPDGSFGFLSHAASRMVYGYISKTCPRLRDVTISGSGLRLGLNGGISLLSKLQELRHLVVMTKSGEDLKKDDLGWLALDLDPARNVEKKKLLERFITVEDRTIYSRTPFKSTLLSQNMPSKGRQKHLKPTIKPTEPNSRRYRDRKSSNGDTESDSDNEEEDIRRSKKKATKTISSPPTATEEEGADYMMSGADMRGLGHLQDIGAMFQSRANKRWQCWPELEYLEFRNQPSRQPDDNRTIERWVQGIRPRIQFKCVAVQGYQLR